MNDLPHARHSHFAVLLCFGFALRLPGCRRNVGHIRENPIPAEGVAARYEDKETALWKSRQAGRTSCSPRDSKQGKDPPPELHLRQSQSRQEQDHKEAEAARPGQDQDCGQSKAGEKAGRSETQGRSYPNSGCTRIKAPPPGTHHRQNQSCQEQDRKEAEAA